MPKAFYRYKVSLLETTRCYMLNPKCLWKLMFAWLIVLVCISAVAAQIYGRKLVFRDEFTGTPGSAPDTTKWRTEIGGNGWGNQELEYYTNSTDNAYLDGGGSLVIKAIK